LPQEPLLNSSLGYTTFLPAAGIGSKIQAGIDTSITTVELNQESMQGEINNQS
jgi:hypothetical protein